MACLVVLDDKPLRRRDVLAAQQCVASKWPYGSDITKLVGLRGCEFIRALCEMTGDALPDVRSRLQQAQGMG